MRYFLLMKQSPYNLIAIIGPTASGKSDLAIALAKKYDGEVISADSRQVYRGMDIGTGKVTRDPNTSHPERNDDFSRNTVEGSHQGQDPSTRRLGRDDTYLSEGIIHHLIDVASPRREYNISHFLRDAKKAIAHIEKRGKLSIICGGTHFWIQTLLTGQTLPEVKPDKLLRAKLEKKSPAELFEMLKEKDPKRASTIDSKNKYRLIRALEICDTMGSVPDTKYKIQNTKYNSLIIALNPEKELLRERIQTRLEKRFDVGMIEEVKELRTSGISWKRFEGFGLEYRYIARFLQEKISENEMREKLFFEIWHYAKRQISFICRWEKQGARIHWIENATEGMAIVTQYPSMNQPTK